MSDPAPENPFAAVRGDRKIINDMMRTMSTQLQSLSAQADAKANIVITVGALALTISLGGWSDRELRPSIVVLGAGALVSMTLAVLAVLPTYRSQVRDKNNPLFFAQIAGRPCDEFVQSLAEAVASDAETLRSFSRDIWSQSHYLVTRKYRYLRAAYIAMLSAFIGAGAALLVGSLVGFA